MSMRVLHLSGSVHHWSGNEQQLADLMKHLTPLGVENFVFCYKDAAIEKYAYEHDIATFAQNRHSIYSLYLAKHLRDCVRQNKIDVIHAHTANFLTVYMLADMLFRMNIPTIFSRKGFSEKSSFISRLKYNYSGIDSFICVSNAVRKNFSQFIKKVNLHKLNVIYDGIDVSKKYAMCTENIREMFSISLDKKIIGNIANHVPAKDLFTWVKTVDYLINILGRKDVHFLQIGNFTEFTPQLKTAIEQNHLNEYITFTGKIPNASRWMPFFDLYLMTSCSEGLPLAIYEAFLYRIPVVTTNAGGISEAVTQNYNGLMSEIGDYRQLAEYVDRLLSDGTLRQTFADNAYRLVTEKFTAQNCAIQTHELYKQILDKK